MNLQDFSLLKEDDHSYTVGHPSGRSMQVDKRGLSEKAHQVIQRLKPAQKMADGGEPEVAPEPEEGAPEEPIQDVDLQKTPGPDDATEETPAPAPAAADDSGSTDLNAPLKQTEGAIQAAGDAEQQAAGQTQGASSEAAQGISELKPANQIAQEADVANQKIATALADPSNKLDGGRWFHNLDTSHKIATGIGVVLGGIGAGLTGQPNMALGIVNNAIDRDMESQRNDQSNKMNLWKMNREQSQSDIEANIHTQNQLLAVANQKIAAAAAGAQGPQAAARAAQLILPIKQQMVQNNRLLGLLKGSDTDPQQLVPYLVPKEQQPEVSKQIGQAQAASKNENQMLQLFDQASKENTVAKTGAGLLRTPGSMLTLTALGDPLIHDQDGRVNEFEKKDFQGLLPAPGDSDEKINQKRRGLQMFINNKKSAPLAKANNIDISRFNSTKTKTNNYQPGQVVQVRGQTLKVGPDGDSLLPL